MPDPRHLFVVGAQRCGTTYLWRLLDDHPDITMARPVRPEPKGLLGPDADRLDAETYRARWFGAAATPVLGEKTTSYLDHEPALARIARLFPDAIVVVALRDPVARAISHHRFSAASGVEDRPAAGVLGDVASELRTWDSNAVSVNPFAYTSRGHYAESLDRLWQHVPPEQTHVIVFEELVRSPAPIAGLYRALGVPPHAPSCLGEVVNASVGPAPELDPDLLDRLRLHFAAPNAALASLLGRELPW